MTISAETKTFIVETACRSNRQIECLYRLEPGYMTKLAATYLRIRLEQGMTVPSAYTGTLADWTRLEAVFSVLIDRDLITVEDTAAYVIDMLTSHWLVL